MGSACIDMNMSTLESNLEYIVYEEGHTRAGMIDVYIEGRLVRSEYRLGHPKHGVLIYPPQSLLENTSEDALL